MEIRILGNQPEPSLTMKGYEITDFELRTKNETVFEAGKYLVNQWIDENPAYEHCQLFIDDPMTVGIYPQHLDGSEAFNNLVLRLENLGFYGKAAGYREIA